MRVAERPAVEQPRLTRSELQLVAAQSSAACEARSLSLSCAKDLKAKQDHTEAHQAGTATLAGPAPYAAWQVLHDLQVMWLTLSACLWEKEQLDAD